jgi:starch synthase (maltosyl-transferring)
MSILPPVKPDDSHQTQGVTRRTFHIEDIYPAVDAGRFAVKRVAGELIDVWADIFRDGHDVVAADLLWRMHDATQWQRVPMVHHGNDRWTGEFKPLDPGHYFYAIEAWTDEFATWRHGAHLKNEAGQDISMDVLEGAAMITKAQPSDRPDAVVLASACDTFLKTGDFSLILSDDVAAAMAKAQLRPDATLSALMPLTVDRARAASGAWYEMVPRSQGQVDGKHGTFKDCIARFPDIAAMGFDVVYFTPIHPIGRVNRKGRNNALTAAEGDPGSPYAIGAAEGGHDTVHPELGTLDDFRALVAAAKSHNMEIALDFAVQCAPDHPWIKQHPSWFKRRPDGSIRYAENPPKKYEDIHNPDFGCDDAEALWGALRDIVWFWVTQGVKIFRVDNPHTKPFPFWEWLIKDIQTRDPEVIFLAEAFTRPKLMKGLAKLGFSQSYTYFTWRTQKWEIEQYLRELTGYPERDYYRPNFFVSTPDILPFHLQGGEAWMFKSRAALAATLSATYGIYNGFELLEHEPIPGKEEYLNSEKYEIKVRDWNKAGNIKSYLSDLNKARRSNRALQQTARLQFLNVDDPNVIGFVKTTADHGNVAAVAIALTQDMHDIWLPVGDADVLTETGLKKVVALEDMITGERHAVEWGGVRLRIDPHRDPARLFKCLA